MKMEIKRVTTIIPPEFIIALMGYIDTFKNQRSRLRSWLFLFALASQAHIYFHFLMLLSITTKYVQPWYKNFGAIFCNLWVNQNVCLTL
jgi:hypothetical protein